MTGSANLQNIACAQLTATPDVEADIKSALALLRQAAEGGANLIALPEFCAGLAVENGALAPRAYREDAHPALLAFREFAATAGVEVLIGSLSVLDAGAVVNRSFMIGSDGAVQHRYDKIHMFDIDLGAGHRYCESDVTRPGERAVLTRALGATAGMSVCYDLRFPHLYRDYAQAGAQLLFIPAAFTWQTGNAHWHVLLRARAIENGAFDIAPGQCGELSGGGRLYGHSLIISPWGEVLAEADETVCVISAAIDLGQVAETRRRIPSLANERAYAAPEPALRQEDRFA